MDDILQAGAQRAARSARQRVWIAAAAGVTILVLLIAGLASVVVWSRRTQGVATSASAPQSLERYRGPWESAMRKAGVTAEFPGGTVDLERVIPSGRKRFSATFTPEEVAALLAVYRYRTDAFGGQAGLEDVEVSFPAPERAALSGNVTLNGQSYHASIEAPVAFSTGMILLGQSDAELSVEGFSVGGRQRVRALSTLSEYLNSMLAVLPGVTIDRAQIVCGGVHVEGWCPSRIEHPSLLPPTGADAIAMRPGSG